MRYLLTLIVCFLSTTSFAASPQPVYAKDAMVVSAQHLASQVGLRILKDGGNAVDAAVAMGYALAVVHPCCGNIGGGGFMLIHQADGKNVFLNFREKAPKAISAKLFLDKKGKVDKTKLSTGHLEGDANKAYLAIGIPGTVMGLNTALKDYGTLPLKTVMQAAIKLAQNGFILSRQDAKTLQYGATSFAKQPNVAAIFLNNGKPYKAGERLVQKNLAKTLEEIAHYGSKTFYSGKIADEVVAASKKHGGIITKQDLENYSITQEKPIICNYRKYEIISAPPPSAGGVVICEMLNILSAYPLHKYGFHSAKSIHYMTEAMRYTYADRNTYLGDPDFIDNPINRLLSDKHAASIRRKIKTHSAGNSKKIGFIVNRKESDHTTSYVVADKLGNVVSVTYTLNNYFGSKVIAGNTGFFLNNELDDFTIKPGVKNSFGLVQGKANIIKPGKRPLSSMAPTIILKDNKFYLTLGTPGGSTIPTTLLQVLINVIDYGMNIQQAVDAPRFHMQWLPDKIFTEPHSISKDTEQKLKKMGYKIQLGSVYSKSLYWGGVTAIMKDPKNNELEGAIDSRRPAGLAMGY